jgi:hypothetical protein
MRKKSYEMESAMKKKLFKKIAMKKELLVILFFFASLAFYSCTDGEPIEKDYTISQSIGLRATLNKIKADNGIDGRNQSNTFSACFDFVYPLYLSYNNSTEVTVSSFEGLLTILTNENQSLYIDGISFPFKIAASGNGTITTINDESDFQNTIESCGFTTFNDYIMNGPCYDFVYPFTVTNHSNQTFVFNAQTQMLEVISGNNGNYILDIVYPFSVIKNNQTITIQNAYQFFEFNDDCEDPCNCLPIEAPVCVQTSSGILQFQNECIANCAGFSSDDFVNCN